MRPTTLDDIIGLEHLLAADAPLLISRAKPSVLYYLHG